MLNQLLEHSTLTSSQAKELLYKMAKAEINEAGLASILTVFRMRALTLEELSGFRTGLLELAQTVDLSDFETIDVCGSGGDNRESFNISTCAAFIVAGAGVKVAKHGNYAASSKVGSSNVLESLGVKFSGQRDFLMRCLEKAGICYLHAPLFHPAMKNVAPVRKALGLRTVFNILGPLVNPSQPKFQLIGTATHELARLYTYFLQPTRTNFLIVHSLDGFDEASLTSKLKIIKRDKERLATPTELGFETVLGSDLAGGNDSHENAKIIREVLELKGSKAKTEVSVANAALALSLVQDGFSFADSVACARESLHSGQALRALNQLLEVSHGYAA